MADEVNVIRNISWREVLPFTLIFRTFRVAIHPSKLVLALAALIAVYVGGNLLDTVWPETYRAVPEEMRDYEAARGTIDTHQMLLTYRDEEKKAQIARAKSELIMIGKPDADPNDLRPLKDKYLSDRDAERKAADDEYNKEQKEAEDAYSKDKSDKARTEKLDKAKTDHILAVNQAYTRCEARWNDVNRPSVGLARTFFIYELSKLNRIVYAVRSGNFLGPDGVSSSVLAFFAVGPVWAIREHYVFFTLFGLYFLTIWSVFGGAISRIAAVHISRDEKISVRQALAFSTSKFLSFVSAPIIPLLIVLAIGLVVALGGVLVNIPFIGPIVVGALYFLALLAGFVITLVMLGLAGGFNLMYPTIAVEGSDSFDAISRSFSYLYARPWRLLFYTMVAVAYGALTYLFVRYFIYLLLSMAHLFTGLLILSHADSYAPLWQTIWPSPSSVGRLSYDIDWMSLDMGQQIGAVLIFIWVHLTVAMLGAFTISFYFSANTVIYYLMRKEVDATELDDVYLELTDEEFAETPVGSAPAESAETPAATQSPQSTAGESPAGT